MSDKPCKSCPFGPNRDDCWGKGILERAVGVVEDEIKAGKLEPGQPQVCHMLLSMKIKLGEQRDNEVAAKDKSEECVGHRLYLEGHVF